MRISDWSSDVCSSDLYYGTALSEGVREIGWTGELLDEHYDEFVFRGTLDKSLPIEKVLYIPVVQECASGTERWIEIPAEIGRASCRERVCQSVAMSVVAVSLKKKRTSQRNEVQ